MQADYYESRPSLSVLKGPSRLFVVVIVVVVVNMGMFAKYELPCNFVEGFLSLVRVLSILARRGAFILAKVYL